MRKGFTIDHSLMITRRPNAILVSNYTPDNEIVNYSTDDTLEAVRADKTRSDVGMWKIKYKNNAITA